MGKKLVAARDLAAGHVIAAGDLVAKSPADGGLPPYELDDLLGGRSLRPLAPEQDVTFEDVGCGGAAARGSRRRVSDPLFDLSGRVAVVTGGMGQLGAELSVALAERGHARRDPRPRDRAARRRCGARTALDDGTIRAHACDVTDRAAVEAALALVEVGLGRAASARQRGGDRRAARRAGRRGRAVRGRAARARSSAWCTSTSSASSCRAR